MKFIGQVFVGRIGARGQRQQSTTVYRFVVRACRITSDLKAIFLTRRAFRDKCHHSRFKIKALTFISRLAAMDDCTDYETHLLNLNTWPARCAASLRQGCRYKLAIKLVTVLAKVPLSICSRPIFIHRLTFWILSTPRGSRRVDDRTYTKHSGPVNPRASPMRRGLETVDYG